MRLADLLRFTNGALAAHPLRTMLSLGGIAVGITAVVLLTALGEGLHRFIVSQFTQFGTHLVQVTPGKRSTHGAGVGLVGTVRPLTLEDAQALERLPGVHYVVPAVQGNAEVKHGALTRRTVVFGVGPQFDRAFSFRVRAGRFLPPDDPRSPRPFVVLGKRVADGLFPAGGALGAVVRVAGERYRVIGLMAPKGRMLNFDLDDAVYIPVGRALALFDREGLMEIDVVYRPEIDEERLVGRIREVLSRRHGEEDFTVSTQKDQLAVLDRILAVITFAVGALGGISLLVGAVGILTIMIIAVHERVHEIGLLRALGARRRQILVLFLLEAALISAAGGMAGLVVGIGGAGVLHWMVPDLPVHVSWGFALIALIASGLIGLLSGVWPAMKAARLRPVEALREE